MNLQNLTIPRQEHDIEWPLEQGNDLVISIYNDNGDQLIDISSGFFVWTVRRTKDDSNYIVRKTSDISSEIEITNGPKGEVTIKILATDFPLSEVPGKCYYDLWYTSNGGKPQRIIWGKWILLSNVYKSTDI